MGSINLGSNIDAVIFEQILEMDGDVNGSDFSRSIVFDFFEQAEQIFEQMDIALYVE
jgi:osomolarity two-component system phosphorelay intermediate protein YPD1